MDSPSDNIAHSNSEKQMDWLWMEIRKTRLDEHLSPEYSHPHTHSTGQMEEKWMGIEVVEGIIREITPDEFWIFIIL